MKTALTDSEAFAAVLAAEANAVAGDHPEVERLLDYKSGTLDAGTELSVQNHLVGCRRCTRKLLDLEPFRETEGEPEAREGVADLETLFAWRDFEERIRPVATSGPPSWSLYAAAAMLAGVLGLSSWVVQLRSVNHDLRQAVVEAPTLATVDEAMRGPGSTIQVEVPSEVQSYILEILPPAELPPFEIEILDGRGQLRLRQEWHGPNIGGALHLRLSRQSFPEGSYRIRVRGVKDGQQEHLLERRLQIRYL